MLSCKSLESQDALHVAVVARTSDIRVSLAFCIGHDAAYNLLLKRMCCRFAQVIGVTSDPRITFPYLLKIRTSTLGSPQRSLTTIQATCAGHHAWRSRVARSRLACAPHRPWRMTPARRQERLACPYIPRALPGRLSA